uniref:EGF-like domain-containing protein n=1 Tax=Alexandrium monilatum TaxID=311494 RepID=A0A7S4RAG8_9DINO
MERFSRTAQSRAALAALAAVSLLALQGCGGGGGGSGTTTAAPTTTSTKPYVAPGQCSDTQRKGGCAGGFCNEADGSCQCFPNYDKIGDSCVQPAKPKPFSFYMYRAQDDRNFNWANDDLASLSGAVWYLHNEVVIQSCPRHYSITRLIRLNVTVHNTDAMFAVRKSLFGPFATFDSLGCHNCQEEIFSKWGYVVGCQIPGAADNYTWAGYKPVWYSLPGECPSKDVDHKTPKCKKDEPGGQCLTPDGSSTCTWNYTNAGEVKIDELYGPGFSYSEFCAKLGGQNIPGEYDRNQDKGKLGITFWNDRDSKVKNAQRVEAVRAIFKKKYPDMPDLPEPWCDWGSPPPSLRSEKVVV